jgi:hypothetical protein
MLPNQLAIENFSGYPPEARRVAASQIPILRRLPLSFVPLLLRELIVYDWKFPAERKDLDRQFKYLASLPAGELRHSLAAFEQLRLAPDLEKTDWVNAPTTFSEKLSAHLWNTHQIDLFRTAATDYMKKSSSADQDEALPTHRLGIAVIGQGVRDNSYPLFRKLAPHGVYFTQVQHEDGLNLLMNPLAKRAAAHPEPYSHWYIDGGPGVAVSKGGIARVSYGALSPARAALHSRMQKTYEGGVFDPEAFRSMLARIRPEEIGLGSGADAVLNRFQLSVLTEGSGTQVFSTTFVQWTAREALRRAQPLTLFARFTPRQRERPMNELLAESQRPPELDPQGSLIDADMGAYYTWLNQQRLSGAEKATFLVWFEGHEEAVVIAPSMERGKRVDTPVRLADLIEKVA